MEKWDGENGEKNKLSEMEVHGIGCRTEVRESWRDRVADKPHPLWYVSLTFTGCFGGGGAEGEKRERYTQCHVPCSIYTSVTQLRSVHIQYWLHSTPPPPPILYNVHVKRCEGGYPCTQA